MDWTVINNFLQLSDLIANEFPDLIFAKIKKICFYEKSRSIVYCSRVGLGFYWSKCHFLNGLYAEGLCQSWVQLLRLILFVHRVFIGYFFIFYFSSNKIVLI